MKEIKIRNLAVGGKCLFQLSTWAPSKLKHVTIRYVGDKYIIMHNTEKDDEYCVTFCPHDCMEQGRKPMFYVSEEL